MDNPSFLSDSTPANFLTIEEDVLQAHIETVNAAANVAVPFTGWRTRIKQIWKGYHWRMRHYFYIHLFVFFCNTLICGAIVWTIENRQVPYIDCWFISATCVFTCGLQTYEFAAFNRSSQSILLFYTWISGITISTLPAIFIKLNRVNHEVVSSEEEHDVPGVENDFLPIKRLVPSDVTDPNTYEKINSLPSPKRLRVVAYILMIILILSTCFAIYVVSFVAIGIWLKYRYRPEDLVQGNRTMSPFYASIVITITGFNQNGLSPWLGGIGLLVDDVFMSVAIIFAVMSGTSLFPAIMRGVVNFCKFVAPWRFKIFFDYILLNNHRLSAVIFPSVQTRLYVTITVLLQVLGVVVALILDFRNPSLEKYPGGIRFLIFMLETANTRFGGYATTDISTLSAATLIIFVLLMGVKPQMLCAIDETPFEMEWILIQTQQQIENRVSSSRRGSIQIFLPFNRVKHYLARQGSITRAQAKNYFSRMNRATKARVAMSQLNEKRLQHRLSLLSNDLFDESHEDRPISSTRISFLRMKLMLIIFCRHIILSLFSFLTSTRTWLFAFIFLISAFESHHMTPKDPSITVFRIIFEVISAFGGCGLSMGHPSVSTSLATMFSTPSKIILILTMCMGRHRGLLDSMKDQEGIEYSAQTLIDSWKQLAIFEAIEQRKSIALNRHREEPFTLETIEARSPSITRF